MVRLAVSRLRKRLAAAPWAAMLAFLLLSACEDAAEDKPAADVIQNADAVTDSVSNKDVAKADLPKADTSIVCKPWLTPSEWNCPADTHCSYDEDDNVACVPNGTHDMGEACDDGGGCKIGVCIQSQNGQQRCSPHCTIASHCQSKSCNGVVDKPYKTCDMASYKTCNPLDSQCEGGLGCYVLGGSGFVCVKAGELTAGDTCKANYDCGPGLHCAGLGSGGSLDSGLCKPLCKVGGGAPMCESPATPCTPINGAAGFCDQ
jgi:hypothetical protein